MRICVSTHQGKLYDDEITYAVVKNEDGEFAIMKDHVPIVCVIPKGYVKLVVPEQELYLAVVNGKFLDNNKHILKNYMMIDEKNGISCIINDANNEKGKEAVLYYQKIGEYNNTSLVVIELVTGRHHQIRLQLANINHPILGDVLYGDNTRKLPLALACFVLTFFHPITKEKLQFTHEPYNALFTTFLLQKNIKESIICKK